MYWGRSCYLYWILSSTAAVSSKYHTWKKCNVDIQRVIVAMFSFACSAYIIPSLFLLPQHIHTIVCVWEILQLIFPIGKNILSNMNESEESWRKKASPLCLQIDSIDNSLTFTMYVWFADDSPNGLTYWWFTWFNCTLLMYSLPIQPHVLFRLILIHIDIS